MLYMLLYFTDNVKALESVWLIGDNFLFNIHPAIQLLHTEACRRGQPEPYLYSKYNLEGFYFNPLNPLKPILVRFLNSLIEGLNLAPHPPKYVICLPDKDLIEHVKNFTSGVKKTIKK